MTASEDTLDHIHRRLMDDNEAMRDIIMDPNVYLDPIDTNPIESYIKYKIESTKVARIDEDDPFEVVDMRSAMWEEIEHDLVPLMNHMRKRQ